MLDHLIYIRLPAENEKPLFASHSAAETVISAVISAQKQGWLRLHGFCVMPEALEMVTTPIRQGVSGLVAHIQAETIPPLMVLLPQAGMVWARQYTQTSLTSQRALDARLEMLLLAPVAGGIVETAAQYPYSSANTRYIAMVAPYAGFQKLTPPPAAVVIEAPRPAVPETSPEEPALSNE